MSYFYPPEKFIASTVLDMDAFNKDVQAWGAEVNGQLGEHNFVSDAAAGAVTNDVTASDIAVRMYGKKKKIDPHAATNTMFRCPYSTRWSPVDDTGSSTYDCRGGQVLVIISFQCHLPIVASAQGGLVFCIEVDGTPMMDTLLGTGDQSNDFLDTAFNATVGGGEVTYDYGTSPSFRATQIKLQVKGLFDLPAGRHTIRLVCRNLFTISAAAYQFISQRETIFLELWS